ncbi:hypothetical protein NUW54_g6466 [Trametes sanguinea]|uniref:Uncharacterized protein n=1 Tax=Trametes sanguinea TaxID=158606 RepID=A0ACC1PU94_9APHY|nr:hypothetical protein NUW54_g6466 [Trametes sanguinea]
MAPLGPCFCSICIEGEYEDIRGERAPGTLQPARVRQLHAIEDRKHRVAATRAANDALEVESTILLATMNMEDHRTRDSMSMWNEDIRDDGKNQGSQSTASASAQRTGVVGSPSSCPDPDRPEDEEEELRRRHSQDSIPPLASGDSTSQAFESYRTWLRDQISLCESEDFRPVGNKDADHRLAALLRRLYAELGRLNSLEEYCWDRKKILGRVPGLYFLPDVSEPIIIPPAPSPPKRIQKQPFLLCALVMVCILHSVAHVARPYANFILATIKVLLLGAVTFSSGSSELTAAQRNLLRQCPSDVRTAMKILGLDLDADTTVYAACPKCCSIYPPKPRDDKRRHRYPSTCTFIETDKAPCGESLLEPRERGKARRRRKSGRPIEDLETVPRCPYPYRSFKSWVVEMLAQLVRHMRWRDSQVGWASLLGLVIIGAGDAEGDAVLAGALRIVWILASAPHLARTTSIAA